jgi:hypothetical protein
MSTDTRAAKRKPITGDKVTVYDTWTDDHRKGTVVSPLSVQFTYEDADNGKIYFCPYNGQWAFDLTDG